MTTLFVHSDRGSQYCSHQYRQIIARHSFTMSIMAGYSEHTFYTSANWLYIRFGYDGLIWENRSGVVFFSESSV